MSACARKYDFTGKVALVTGSSSGIGAEIAIQFASYGARVAITGRNAANLQKVADRIVQASGGVKPLQIIGDLFDESLPGRLVRETVAAFGQLDILVNNAGGASPRGSLDSPNLLEEFDNMIKLNVRQVLEMTQIATPYLARTKGNVVNISSIAAVKPIMLVYSTAKAALDMLTKSAALELGAKGVRVNSVNPGPVATGFGRSMGLNAEDGAAMLKEYGKTTVLARVCPPSEIANLAVFLASADAANITGSIMFSEGGMLLK